MKNLNIGIIPVRMNSSRFPGKPLKKIHRIPMLGHICARTSMAEKLDDFYVATCDSEIKKYCETINARCILTSKQHSRASDRTAEAIKKIELNYKKKVSNIIMIQGDEPLVHPEMIDNTISELNKKNIEVTNIVTEIENNKDWLNPNIIKVLNDNSNNAIYFSRKPIPFMKKFNSKQTLRQIYIIGFTRSSLRKFNSLNESKFEISESIDMNRFIENDIKVRLIRTKKKPLPVDTVQDLRKVSKLMIRDKLFMKYKENYV